MPNFSGYDRNTALEPPRCLTTAEIDEVAGGIIPLAAAIVIAICVGSIIAAAKAQ
jgi:lactobin A/cerein 7B family class IIb bacteriocin